MKEQMQKLVVEPFEPVPKAPVPKKQVLVPQAPVLLGPVPQEPLPRKQVYLPGLIRLPGVLLP